MQIILFKGGFRHCYDHNTIAFTDCDYDTGNCTVTFHDMSTKTIKTPCSSYNSQYGIPVSPDGKLLFYTDWYKGLYVHQIDDGKLIWYMRKSRLTSMHVTEDCLYVTRYCKTFYKIDYHNQTIVNEITGTDINKFVYFEDDTCLLWFSKGCICHIDCKTFDIIAKYPNKIYNPNECLSLRVRNAYRQNNTFYIEGFESYPHRTRTAHEETVWFTRALN